MSVRLAHSDWLEKRVQKKGYNHTPYGPFSPSARSSVCFLFGKSWGATGELEPGPDGAKPGKEDSGVELQTGEG